jgi:hypothetical protein
MNRKLSLLFLVVVFWFPGYMLAQNANGIIDPSRIIDWTNAGVQGGIPNRTTVCTTLSPGASVSQINSAIATCPSNGVVYLNAGTYNLSSGIDFAGHGNVTLRGAGPDKTFLVFTGGISCATDSASICIQGSVVYAGSPSNLTNMTGGYSRGSTQVSLSSVTNLAVGGIIDFDQLNDSSDPGDIYVCDASGSCSMEGTGGVYRSGRAQNQVATVTGINGTTISITPGIYMPNWRSSQSPQAYWPNTTITNVGVENLSIDNSNSSAKAALMFASASNCWERNVRSLNVNRDHVWMWITSHISVIDNYYYGTQSGQSSEYGVEPDRDSDSLIENNIFQHIVSPIVPGPTAGDVIAYNYTIDDWDTESASWMEEAIFVHSAGTGFCLFEGNEANGLESDDIHGSHDFSTFFRNRLLGWEATKSTSTIPAELMSFSRYYNMIGNVLGYPGYHTQYQDLAPNGRNSSKSIYVLGWGGQDGNTSNAPNDTNVVSTLMRWGNYDVVTGAVRWDPSEVPSSLTQYPNPVPSSQSLPTSFFLSSRPSWWSTPWGTPPWPAIGPDVTGGSGPGGHAYDIPAKLCYNNTSKDSNGILNFNANNCYTSSPAPAAPTDLGAIAH